MMLKYKLVRNKAITTRYLIKFSPLKKFWDWYTMRLKYPWTVINFCESGLKECFKHSNFERANVIISDRYLKGAVRFKYGRIMDDVSFYYYQDNQWNKINMFHKTYRTLYIILMKHKIYHNTDFFIKLSIDE